MTPRSPRWRCSRLPGARLTDRGSFSYALPLIHRRAPCFGPTRQRMLRPGSPPPLMPRCHDALMPSSRTRSPVDEECSKIRFTDGAVAVEVGRAVRLRRTWPPSCQQREQIGRADDTVVIEIPGAHSGGGSIKEICRADFRAADVDQRGPDDGGSTADRDGAAEVVVRRTVLGMELCDLPDRGGSGIGPFARPGP